MYHNLPVPRWELPYRREYLNRFESIRQRLERARGPSYPRLQQHSLALNRQHDELWLELQSRISYPLVARFQEQANAAGEDIGHTARFLIADMPHCLPNTGTWRTDGGDPQKYWDSYGKTMVERLIEFFTTKLYMPAFLGWRVMEILETIPGIWTALLFNNRYENKPEHIARIKEQLNSLTARQSSIRQAVNLKHTAFTAPLDDLRTYGRGNYLDSFTLSVSEQQMAQWAKEILHPHISSHPDSTPVLLTSITHSPGFLYWVLLQETGAEEGQLGDLLVLLTKLMEQPSRARKERYASPYLQKIKGSVCAFLEDACSGLRVPSYAKAHTELLNQAHSPGLRLLSFCRYVSERLAARETPLANWSQTYWDKHIRNHHLDILTWLRTATWEPFDEDVDRSLLLAAPVLACEPAEPEPTPLPLPDELPAKLEPAPRLVMLETIGSNRPKILAEAGQGIWADDIISQLPTTAGVPGDSLRQALWFFVTCPENIRSTMPWERIDGHIWHKLKRGKARILARLENNTLYFHAYPRKDYNSIKRQVDWS